jgi:uncharacterized coiled-coil DUF342 family protein
MDRTEIRKKQVPGAREIILQIKQLTADIDSVSNEITGCKEHLSNLISAERNSSPKSKLLNELQQENEIKNLLRNEKNELLASNEQSKKKIMSLKDSMEFSSNNFNTIEKVNNALEELELKLISTSVTSKEENEISTKMSHLRIQKSKIAENENNHKLISELDSSIKENKAKLTEINLKLNEKTAIITSLREQLDKLSEAGFIKSPEVIKAEAKFTGLKNQKDELFKQRNVLREKIHVLEEEFAKFETELLIQKSLEEQKDEIKKSISQLKAEKENLLSEQGSYDPAIFDSLIFTVKAVLKSGSLNLNLDLVTQLMKYGINIPSDLETLKLTVEALNKKKIECSGSLKSKNDKVASSISSISAKIEDLTAKLNQLPATDFEILKKGGVRVGGFRNKDKF